MNINNYAHSKADVIRLFLKQNNGNRLQTITLISVCNHIPIIACLFFVGDELGWTQDILDNIKILYKVYSYKNIEGIPDSYPGERL